MPSSTVLTDIIRNEIRFCRWRSAATPAEVTSTPVRETSLDGTPVVASHSDSGRRPSFLYRHSTPQRSPPHRLTDIWPTQNHRPVCFYCGVPIHVYRYIQNYLQELNSFRYNYRFTHGDDPDSRLEEYEYASRNVPSCCRMSRSPLLSAQRHPTPAACWKHLDRMFSNAFSIFLIAT